MSEQNKSQNATVRIKLGSAIFKAPQLGKMGLLQLTDTPQVIMGECNDNHIAKISYITLWNVPLSVKR